MSNMFTTTYTLKEWLKESSLHFEQTKAFGKKVRKYKNGDQLDETIKRILANRGQPEQFENQIAKHNNSILGHKKDRDVEIKLFGLQQKDKVSATILNNLVKSIVSVGDYEQEVDELDDTLAIEGISIAELAISDTGEYDRFEREHRDVDVNAINPNEMFLDPFSRAKDYNKDARYLTRCFWIDKDDLYSLFDSELVDKITTTNYLASSVDDDLSTDTTLRQRVLLSYTWYRKYDKVAKKEKYYYCFWSDEIILLQNESPYSFDGFPYEIEFLERDFDKKATIKYWGLYRNIMPLQDHINYAKLRLQNMIANNKTLVNRGAIVDENITQFAEEWSYDNATVMVEDINGIKTEKQQTQIQQILNIITDGRNQIAELLNSNKEFLGNANNRMSMVGQQQRIKTGLVGLSRFTDKSDNLQKKIIKKMVSMIVQFYDSERIVSIIDEDYEQDYMVLNQTIENENGYDFEFLEDGKVKPKAMNSLKIGKYDIIYLAKPKEDTGSDERLRLNQELLRTVRESKPELIDFTLPMVLKDMGSPDAKKLRDYIEQSKVENASSPQAQQVEQLEAQVKNLEMMYKNSQINLNNAKAKSMEDKNKIDLQKAFAHTTIAKEQIATKQQQNMINSGRNIQ